MGFGGLAWRVWAKWSRKKGEKNALFGQKLVRKPKKCTPFKQKIAEICRFFKLTFC